jgi:hypothetical protein
MAVLSRLCSCSKLRFGGLQQQRQMEEVFLVVSSPRCVAFNTQVSNRASSILHIWIFRIWTMKVPNFLPIWQEFQTINNNWCNPHTYVLHFRTYVSSAANNVFIVQLIHGK